MLQAPSNQDLSRCPSVLRGDRRHDRMVQPVPAREGAVGLQVNPLLHAELEQLLLVQEGMEFDLVHGGGDGTCRGAPFQVGHSVVTLANRTRRPLFFAFSPRLPPVSSPAPRPPAAAITKRTP